MTAKQRCAFSTGETSPLAAVERCNLSSWYKCIIEIVKICYNYLSNMYKKKYNVYKYVYKSTMILHHRLKTSSNSTLNTFQKYENVFLMLNHST